MTMDNDWLKHPLLQYPKDVLLSALDKLLAEQEFAEFCRQAWPVVEPGRPLVWGWHLQAKCDHLQAVYNHTVPEEVDPQAKQAVGIQRLAINEPPRCSKSLFSSVLFPAWVWTRWPEARFLCVTYADDLAERDAKKCKKLVESEWYRSKWPLRIGDKDTSKWYNIEHWDQKGSKWTQGGYRVSTTILGMATGEGGDFRIIDDPHNVKKALSDVERKQANTFFDLTLPTRVVDPKRYSTIICMQRLHEDDLTGHALAGDNVWDHLCFPMEYEAQGGNRCSTALWFTDPRTEEGELLHPERWDRKAVEEAKNDLRLELGDFGVNSQFGQRPTPLGGGMFKPENLVIVPNWPDLHWLERPVRYWDKAGTEGSGAFTAGALMAFNRQTGRTIILEVRQEQYGTDRREQWIKDTAFSDKSQLGRKAGGYAVRIEQEPGSGGKDSALFTVRNLAGFNAQAIPKTSDKVTEWQPVASQVNAGGMEMVKGPWNNVVIQQMKSAPFGKYKDILDALAGAFKHIHLGGQARVIG